MKFASLCILAYKRPELLKQSLKSLHETIDYPCEIIINFDGDFDCDVEGYSKKIINKGNNRGVGRSFQNCVGVAEGDYIFKLDTDLIYQPHWLSQAIKILDTNEEVGVVGLFDYHKWDVNDSRFQPANNVIKTEKAWDFEYQIVKDFVSSAFGFRKQKIEGDIPDDGFHQSFDGNMALKHSVENTAFGVTRSTYVSGTEDHPFKTPTFDEPLLFGVK